YWKFSGRHHERKGRHRLHPAQYILHGNPGLHRLSQSDEIPVPCSPAGRALPRDDALQILRRKAINVDARRKSAQADKTFRGGLRMSMRILAATLALLFFSISSARAESSIAQTPPMGWNSWNHFACKVTAADVRGAADAITKTGMKEAGYIYVNVDDCWQGARDDQGDIRPNENFGDMKALADYVHETGLKFGIYSWPGPKTCGSYEGSYKAEIGRAHV